MWIHRRIWGTQHFMNDRERQDIRSDHIFECVFPVSPTPAEWVKEFSSDPGHQRAIFLQHNCCSLDGFPLFGGRDSVKIPADQQQSVKHSDQQPVRHQQPCSPRSQSLTRPWLNLSKLSSPCLETKWTGCCHMIGWFGVCLIRQFENVTLTSLKLELTKIKVF